MVGGMGFRDLALHNDSLLAKQAWRLLHNKTSLFYKVFKPRFFPKCSIMEAKESRSGSYAWRSILHGRDVLSRGVRWRVGNGESIKIWQHNWLPRKHPPQVTSFPIASMETAEFLHKMKLPSSRKSHLDELPQRTSFSGHILQMEGTTASQDIDFLRRKLNCKLPKNPTTRIQCFGKTFGVLLCQTKLKTCCGVLAKMRRQPKPTWCKEPLLKIHYAIDAELSMKHLCTHYGSVESWTRCGHLLGWSI